MVEDLALLCPVLGAEAVDGKRFEASGAIEVNEVRPAGNLYGTKNSR
jgi:hypothetical protein